jgi:uncharacterized protein
MDVEFEFETMLFRWHAEKAEINFTRHGIRFEQAAEAFFDVDFRLTDASRNDEARDALIGRDLLGMILFVVHIEIESDAIRLISARRATVTERKFYGDT